MLEGVKGWGNTQKWVMFSEELVMSRYYCNNGSPYFLGD